MITLVIIAMAELAFGPVVDGMLDFATSASFSGVSPEFTTAAISNFAWYHSGLRILLITTIVWVILRTVMAAFYTREEVYQRW
jgi:hypothetical protein